MKDITFVDVSGFLFSGSSAVVDLLKEFNGFYESKAEIRFISDPYGIVQMEDAIVNKWGLITSTAAISDFITMCKKGCRYGKGLFSPAGFSLKKNISPQFMDITYEYIDELTDYYYKKDYYHYKFKKSYLKFVTDRYRWAIEYLTKGKLKTANRNIAQCYFSHPTQERFNVATKRYFDRLFENHTEGGNGKSFVILDQAVAANNSEVIRRYFTKAKMIIVDRDPRDMYVDEILWGSNLDKDYQTREAGHRYALRAKALREGIKLSEDVIKVQFEDLILNYDETVSRIMAFIGIGKEYHCQKNKFLKPEVSRKNIGLWKKHYNECKDALDVISEELSELCYNYE